MTGPLTLNRRILRLAIPNLLASVSVPLIGIADTAMIGHLDQVAFLGAVATASVILDVIFWGAGFLRMGTTSIVAQYHGAGDRSACARSLYRGLLLALVIGAGILLLRQPIAWIGFELAGGSEEVRYWGQRYIDVRIWSVPLNLSVLVLIGFFLGTANVLVPMYITFATNLVNVAADYALIFGNWGAPEMGVVGAAWAALLSSAVGLAVGLLALAARYRDYLRQSAGQLFDRAAMRHLMSTNTYLLARTLCLLFSQFFLLSVVSRLGEVPLAAHAIVWQVWGLVSFAVDGFAHAAETLVGNSLGAGDFAGTRQVCRRIMGWGIGTGFCFAAAFGTGMNELASAFTEHREVVAAILPLTPMLALAQPMNAAVFVFDGIFIGANDVAYLSGAMLVTALFFFLPAVGLLVFLLDGGLLEAWLAYIVLMFGRLVTLWKRYRSDAWLRTFVSSR